jgi:hypothetical protein
VRRHVKASFVGETQRGPFGVGRSALIFLALVAFLGSSAASAGACPNEDLRVGFSAQLPECRAYERVSPADKGGVDLTTNGYVGFSAEYILGADAPGAVTFPTANAFGDAISASVTNTYLSRRGVSGWQTHAINPPVKAGLLSGAVLRWGMTADLSQALFAGPNKSRLGPIPLTLVDTATRQGTPVADPSEPSEPHAVGYSNDMSHVVVWSFVPLTADSPAGNSSYLYDWTPGGGLVNVGRLPDNSFATGNVEPATEAGLMFHQVSDDGSRIFFKTGGQLYLRENGSITKQVSAPAAGAPAEAEQPAQFEFASVDGSNAFFCSSQRLTADSTAIPGESRDLYRYQVESGELTDLTVTDDPQGAHCSQNVLGGADDGSRLYFMTDSKLTADAPANQEGERDFKIYLWHDDGTPNGALTFVANVPELHSNSDAGLGGAQGGSGARVSQDGRWLAFSWGGEADDLWQVWRYDATTKELVCASCNPDGITHSVLHRSYSEGEQNPQFSERLPRNLLDDGRLFFESRDALVPQDINEDWDVYEYANGQRHLISSGTDGSGRPYDHNNPSLRVYFGDASADGTDVYFETRAQLVPGDNDELVDLYDARVDGGFKSELAPPPPNCDGEACKPPPAPGALIPGAGSAAFAGAGNQGRNSGPPKRRKCGKGHRKCHKHHRSHRHANTNRGGSK